MKKWIKAGLMAGLLAVVVSATSTKAAFAYVICSNYNGNACVTAGLHFTCFNQFPDEPGLCECNGEFWECS